MNEGGASRGTLARRALFVVALFALGVYAYVESPNSIVAPAYVATVISLIVAALPIVWARESDPFEPVAYAAFQLAYGHLGILGALLTDGADALPHLPLGGDQRSRLAVASIGLNVIGFVSYAIGYHLQRRKARDERSPAKTSGGEWSIPRMWIVTFVLGGLAIAAYTAFQLRLGRPLFDFSSLREGKAVWRNDPSMSWMLRGVQLVFVPIALWAAWAFRRRGGLATTAVIIASVFAAAMLLRLGQRGNSIYPLIALLGVFHFLRHRIRWSLLIVGLVFFVQLVNISTSLRSGESEGIEAAMESNDRSAIASFGTHERERGRLDSTAIVLYFFPDRVSYLLGESWKPLLVMLVPRWIDPDKTRGHQWSDTQMLRTLVGFPAPTPLPALLYANFTTFGTIFFMGLYGFFHGRMYSWLRAAPGDPSRTLLYMLTLIFFLPTSAGFSAALQYVVPAFVLLRFIDVASPRASDASPRTQSFSRA